MTITTSSPTVQVNATQDTIKQVFFEYFNLQKLMLIKHFEKIFMKMRRLHS